MHARQLILLLLIASIAFAANSVTITIDGSGSMKDRIGNERKFEIARNATLCLIDSIKEGDEVAIFVFEDYHKVSFILPFTTNKEAMRSAVRSMTSEFGSTDLRAGINVSASYALANASNANKVILVVSDGGAASSALNATAKAFHERGISKIQVIGLNVKNDTNAGKALDNIATNGGGIFYSTLDYATACDAFKEAYNDAAVDEGGKCCPLLIILPLALAICISISKS